MKTIYDIYEGLLDDMEDVLANTENDIKKSMHMDTIPTAKDFQKNPYNKKYYTVSWYCPNVVKKYRNKYPDWINNEMTSIQVILDCGMRVATMDLCFCDKPDVLAKKRSIVGWSEYLVGTTVPNYKKIAITLLRKIATDINKMDIVMEYSYKYWKFMHSHDAKKPMETKSFMTDI